MYRQEIDILRRENGIAYYRQISGILQQKIEDGEFQAGTQLPTESELGRKFGVNRHTAREALKMLKNDGVVYSIKGKGNFVADSKIRYQVSQKMRFSNSILAAGFTPGTQLLGTRCVNADQLLAEKLCLEPGSMVLTIDMLRFATAVPLMMATSYLPAQRFAGLRELLVGSFSLYSLLKEHFGVDAIRHKSVFEAVMPEESDLNWLQIPANVPLLKVQSKANDQFGNPIEYIETRMRGDIGSMEINF